MTQFDLQTKGFKEMVNTGKIPIDGSLIMFTHPTLDKVSVAVTDKYDNSSSDVIFRTSYPYPMMFSAINQVTEGTKVYLLFNHKN